MRSVGGQEIGMTVSEPADAATATDSSMKSRASRTLTAGEVIDRLARVDPSLPVVFDAEDGPLGSYGVRDVSVVRMQRESTYADGAHGRDVYLDTVDGEKEAGPALRPARRCGVPVYVPGTA